jgi:hypothetical protein
MIRALMLIALAASPVALRDAAKPLPTAVPRLALAQGADADPGPEHARLARLAGDWTVTTTFRFGDAPPQEFRGKARATVILGGRFVQFDETAVEFGQEVARQKTFGFNAAARRYESSWRYTGSTAVMNFTGTGRDGGKTIAGDATFAGEGGEAQAFTWDLVEIDANKVSSTLVAAAGEGKPKATFTAVYERQRVTK